MSIALGNVRNQFYYRNRTIILIGGLIVLYLFTRMAFVLRLPPFIDEATHILWARDMLNGNITAGAYDGRWVAIQIFALASLLPFEPLLIARIVAILAGIFTMLAIVFTGRDLFSQKNGLVAGLLYVVFPFALFYDRLALADGLSLAFGAWTLYISVKAVRSTKGYYSVILAVVLMGAILTKTSGVVAIIFPPAAVAFLLPRNQWKSGIKKVAPAVLAGLLIALTLWIRGAGSSGFFEKTSGNLLIDLTILPDNIALAASWYWSLLTPGMAIITILAVIWLSVRQGGREVWFLEFLLLILLLPNVLLYKIWYPRYLLFTLIPLCLLVARFLTDIVRTVETREVPSKIGIAAILIMALGLVISADIAIIVQPDKALQAERLRWQFIEGWPSGYGVAELSDFLEDEAMAGENGINVMRFFNWDQAHQGVNLLLDADRLEINGRRLNFIGTFPPDMLERSADRLIPKKRSIIVFDRANSEAVSIMDEFLIDMDAHIIWDYLRPGGVKGLEVWEVDALLTDPLPDDQT